MNKKVDKGILILMDVPRINRCLCGAAVEFTEIIDTYKEYILLYGKNHRDELGVYIFDNNKKQITCHRHNLEGIVNNCDWKDIQNEGITYK